MLWHFLGVIYNVAAMSVDSTFVEVCSWLTSSENDGHLSAVNHELTLSEPKPRYYWCNSSKYRIAVLESDFNFRLLINIQSSGNYEILESDWQTRVR